MEFCIVAGGPERYLPDLKKFNNANVKWVGVDRGVFTLLENGLEAEGAFGDFDSVSSAEWSLITDRVEKVNTYKPEKDESDLELALNWVLGQNPDSIKIFGATGGRLDHFMGNVQLLMQPTLMESGIKSELIDVQNRLWVVKAGEHEVIELPSHQYISFVPMTGSVEDLTLTGFKYPLKNRNIFRGSTLCISNELIQSSGTFSFTNGILMVVRSSDSTS
ncbi:thiamine diphosphokinase [[Bacillus] enclensis]|uniref:thiamine diphosphokinase n=1 Tax=[Bacillus] enclensis TaxID=1402860 RepID=UPI0018DE83A9|nr:thiamine diphosphokinase [[Bacillus] enclensis]MBH9965524.1 thiamine diphosphokinase [[Bacillus] enclensis]QWC24434.1 thiamine diphosphokinase [Bacillus haikouensis]